MLLVSFEGLDCVGKTTLCAKCFLELERMGYKARMSHEPFGALGFGEDGSERVAFLQELLQTFKEQEAVIGLFALGHLSQSMQITEAEANGCDIFLLDRYLDSFNAYQFHGKVKNIYDLDVSKLELRKLAKMLRKLGNCFRLDAIMFHLHKMFLRRKIRKPDLTFLLFASEKTRLARATSKNETLPENEKEVRERFLDIAREELDGRILVKITESDQFSFIVEKLKCALTGV